MHANAKPVSGIHIIPKNNVTRRARKLMTIVIIKAEEELGILPETEILTRSFRKNQS